METRVEIAYALIAALLLATVYLLTRWRKQVAAERRRQRGWKHR